MRRSAWALVLVLVAAVPAMGWQKRRVIVDELPVPDPALGQPGAGNYVAPKADGAVVELLDEGVEPLFPVLINDGGGEAGTVAREDRDVFAGVEAVRVTPMQKYRSNIPGWNFKIVETPEKAGEFRYLRFAWKKVGGTGLMIQFHDPAKSWGMRFHAGNNIYGWNPSKQVTERPPTEWQLVTRDLFKEYGAFTITGFALTPLDGQSGLYDHMLLGRSVEELDKATDAALGKVKPAAALADKERDALWADLLGTDQKKAGAAIRAFLAAAPDQVAFIGTKLTATAPDKELTTRIRTLIADLDADEFDRRDGAVDALVKIGDPALDMVRALATNGPNDEVRFRARLILKKLGAGGAPVGTAGKMARVVRVLERAANKDARELLGRMADGEFGIDGAPDAKAALARLPKMP